MNSIGDTSNVQYISRKPLFTKEFTHKVLKIGRDGIGLKEHEPLLKTDEDIAKFEEILKITNDALFGDESHYEFKVHEKTGAVMSKLVNTQTGETIREIPSEKILDMIAGLCEIAGIIIDDKI